MEGVFFFLLLFFLAVCTVVSPSYFLLRLCLSGQEGKVHRWSRVVCV